MKDLDHFLKRRFWGWGNIESPVGDAHVVGMLGFLKSLHGIDAQAPLPLPNENEIRLRPPRFDIPESMQGWVFSDKILRLHHCFGKSYRDIWRSLHGRYDNPPDHIAFPENEAQIAELYRFAESNGVAVIPYGGGSSVVGGVEPPAGEKTTGVITVNLLHFNQVLEVDEKSRAARIQCGAYGPELERQLKPHGFTLRHFPQSFEFSTLGGWIATRAGGHYAMQYTHIDEFVESVRLVTPQGVMNTRRLPGSGAGPSEERLISGSEGVLGIITEAWVRLQAVPRFKLATTVAFDDYNQGVEACRQIAQSGLQPSNARYIGRGEALFMGLGEGDKDILILGCESSRFPVDSRMEACVLLAQDAGGVERNPEARKVKESNQDRSADNWKQAFITVPYLRDELVRRGIIVETFETAVTWDKFDHFNARVLAVAKQAITAQCGKGFITCRFTHLYPDGPAPYYTIMAQGNGADDLQRWDAIKQAVSDVLIEEGGTITHHHAVGRDHKSHYLQQASPLFVDMLKSAKSTVDPGGVLNPGVLFD